ncbi:MAG: hypothetical protein IT425_06730 [Pirellulales bacterium]|nr:hypothetical protein [Pirellulales bacterium]
MLPTALWPPKTRIIEIGTTSGELGEAMTSAGYRNYLAVCDSEQRRNRVSEQHPALAPHLATALPLNDLRQNNAEVLILNHGATLALAKFRAVRHAQFVALRVRLTPLAIIGLFLAIVQWALFRFTRPRLFQCGKKGGGCWLVAFRVRKPRPYLGTRRFVPHQLGIAGFLSKLQQARIRHAVLRWFENLPQLPPGEDIDLLVDDASLDAVRAWLNEGPGIQPLDLYSTTGLPGADFRNMPYFPPFLAEQLLERSRSMRGLCRVPAAREHFLSLAYHALYHKGYDSGIPANATSRPHKPRAGHDYVSILRHHANELGFQVPITLSDLDSLLDAEGWRPPHDMLIRLSRRNRWVRDLLKHGSEHASADDRLAVFLLREEALRRGGVPRAQELIEGLGFEVRRVHAFAPGDVQALARSLRGGNWGQGPWPISGGPPVAAIIAFDPAPITPARKQRKRFPFLANARLLGKEQLRDAFNQGFPPEQHCNAIHSSDNGREALDYLRIILPREATSLTSANLPATAHAA